MKLDFKNVLLLALLQSVSSKLTFSRQLKAKSPRALKSNSSIEEKWFTQFLDHYNPMESRTWHQRYYVYDECYKSGGPVFLMLGGDAAVGPTELAGSFVAYLAQQFGAKCFLLEHRFYGASRPTPDLSSENLAHLSIDQVLADTANFIRETRTSSDKWFVFGGSYAASLAAWTRLKYPHLVYAAVADSAPLLARIDFSDYYIVAGELYRKYSAECAEVLEEALREVYASLFTAAGRNKLTRLFNPCKPIELQNATGRDGSSLFVQFLDIAALPALATSEEPSPSISESCSIILDDRRGAALNRLAASFDLVLEYNNASCLVLPSYQDVLASYRDVELSSESMKRQCLYRSCHELGWFATTSAGPFGLAAESLPVQFFEGLCMDVFGPGASERLKRGVERTNAVYGALGLAEVASRIVFVSGEDDPWSSFEIGECDNSDVACIRVRDAGRYALQYPPSDSDTAQVAAAKEAARKQIGQWMA